MKQDVVELNFHRLMDEGLGLDMKDPNLVDTPRRVAKMFAQELFHNVGEEFPEEDFRLFPNDKNYSQIIMVDNIHFVSTCSHHFVPFVGKAWFLYIPDQHLVGVSKLPRLVEHYSARPQLQEGLCHEVMNRFIDVVKPKGAMIVMRAIHGCMSNRGVRQYDNCGMTSSAISGAFNDPATREEAMNLIQLSTHL
jgi:GTP cyclohydrolase I